MSPRCLLTCLIGCLLVSNYSASLSRKRRYLAFPNRAAVVLTISLLKGIASDISASPTIRIVTIHELDVLFPLPHDPSPFELTQTALGQAPVFHDSHSRHRRDVYSQLEDLFYLQGYEGRSCVMRALCEAKLLPQPSKENVIQELLSIIFTLPQNMTEGLEHEYGVTELKCNSHVRSCPFSIFDIALDWGGQFGLFSE